MTNSIILTNDQIVHKTKRIAYQILESNNKEKEIVLAGISGNGFVFGQAKLKADWFTRGGCLSSRFNQELRIYHCGVCASI